MLELCDKIKNHNISNQILKYWYCDNIVGMTIGTFTIYEHNEIFDKSIVMWYNDIQNLRLYLVS